MAILEGVCLEVLQKSEFIAIATAGEDGPHVVAVWGDYIKRLGYGDTLLVPVGGMKKTEANLRHDPRVELICGTQKMASNMSLGKGCGLRGRAGMETSGSHFDHVKKQFPWARAALVIKVEAATPQL